MLLTPGCRQISPRVSRLQAPRCSAQQLLSHRASQAREQWPRLVHSHSTVGKALGPPAEAPQQVSAQLGAGSAPTSAQGLLNTSCFSGQCGDMDTCRAPFFPPCFCSRLGRTGTMSFPRSARFSALTVKGPWSNRVGHRPLHSVKRGERRPLLVSPACRGNQAGFN